MKWGLCRILAQSPFSLGRFLKPLTPEIDYAEFAIFWSLGAEEPALVPYLIVALAEAIGRSGRC